MAQKQSAKQVGIWWRKLVCECGCVNAECCACCLWMGRPRTELEQRSDRIYEHLAELGNLSPAEIDERVERLKRKMRGEA